MALFSSLELGDLESSLAALLPDDAYSPAIRYDSALHNPQDTRVLVVPPPRLVARESAVDFEQLNFAASVESPKPGDVINFTTPDGVDRWFIIVKNLTLGPEIYRRIPINALVVEMPYLLTAKRLDTTALPKRNILGDIADLSTAVVKETAFHAGLTNEYHPLNETVAGPLPKGSKTFYTNLGTDIDTDDTLDLDGKSYVVFQVNIQYANGFAYSRQVILQESGGQTWTD